MLVGNLTISIFQHWSDVMHVDVGSSEVISVDGKESVPDYVSSCGIPLMPVLYQVVGFGQGVGRHSGRHRRSVV